MIGVFLDFVYVFFVQLRWRNEAVEQRVRKTADGRRSIGGYRLDHVPAGEHLIVSPLSTLLVHHYLVIFSAPFAIKMSRISLTLESPEP
jgi:hypothetical protein